MCGLNWCIDYYRVFIIATIVYFNCLWCNYSNINIIIIMYCMQVLLLSNCMVTCIVLS